MRHRRETIRARPEGGDYVVRGSRLTSPVAVIEAVMRMAVGGMGELGKGRSGGRGRLNDQCRMASDGQRREEIEDDDDWGGRVRP